MADDRNRSHDEEPIGRVDEDATGAANEDVDDMDDLDEEDEEDEEEDENSAESVE